MTRRQIAQPSAVAVALSATLALALSGCATDGAASEPPPVTADPPVVDSPEPSEPAPDPSPSTPEEAAALAECEVLTPEADVRGATVENIEFFHEVENLEDHLPGPRAQEALERATDVRACSWAVPSSDTGLAVTAAIIPLDEAESLMEDLRADGFAEQEVNGAPVFTAEVAGGLSTIQVAYMFDGDLWTAVDGSAVDEESAITLADIARGNALVAAQP